mgnify:FL=1
MKKYLNSLSLKVHTGKAASDKEKIKNDKNNSEPNSGWATEVNSSII